MKNGKHKTKEVKSEVIELVSAALKKHTPRKYPAILLIQEKEVRKKKDRWYVPVYTSTDVPSWWDYYDILARAEGEFDESNLNLTLIPPGLPEGVI